MKRISQIKWVIFIPFVNLIVSFLSLMSNRRLYCDKWQLRVVICVFIVGLIVGIPCVLLTDLLSPIFGFADIAVFSVASIFISACLMLCQNDLIKRKQERRESCQNLITKRAGGLPALFAVYISA